LFNRATIVASLIDNHSDVNLTDKYGRSALNISANNGFYPCAMLLVEAGANLNIRDTNGDTPLDRAVSNNHKECGEYLHYVGAECHNKEYPADWD
jgi:potassium channel